MESPPASTTPRRTGVVLLVALAALLCAATWAAELYLLDGRTGFPLDDSWIHLQFARNLAAGEGLAYNAGELVSGSTAPLWTALVALLLVLPASPVMVVKIAGIVLHCAGVRAVLSVSDELGLSRGAGWLAAGLTLGTGWLVWSALSGLEIPLFVLLSLWGVALHLRERRARRGPAWSLAVMAAAVLARPEGALLLALAVADRLLVFERRDDGILTLRRPALEGAGWGLLAAALLLAPVALFNLQVGGSVLPTTFLAKAGGARGWLPDLGYLYAVLGILFRAQPLPLVFAGAGLGALVGRLGTARDRGLLPALWLFGLPLAYSALNPPGGPVVAGNFGRYYFPLFPFLAVVGTLGLEGIGRALGSRLGAGRWRIPWRAVLIVVLLVPSAASLVRAAGRYVQSVGNVEDSDVKIARWLGERLPPQAVLAVNDIGALKYLLPDNRILDLAAIIDPEVGAYRREAVRRGRPAVEGEMRFLEENRPDYLVIFPRWFPGLMAERSGFRPLYSLDIPDNITMGDDRIVVMATPWTRFELRGESGSGGR